MGAAIGLREDFDGSGLRRLARATKTEINAMHHGIGAYGELESRQIRACVMG